MAAASHAYGMAPVCDWYYRTFDVIVLLFEMALPRAELLVFLNW